MYTNYIFITKRIKTKSQVRENKVLHFLVLSSGCSPLFLWRTSPLSPNPYNGEIKIPSLEKPFKITHTHKHNRPSYHILVEAKYRCHISTAVTVIWRRPHLHHPRHNHQSKMTNHVSIYQENKQLTVTSPLSWNIYFRPSWTSWWARQTRSSLLIWLNCKTKSKHFSLI